MTDNWTPDQPLRADATDEQIERRFDFLWGDKPSCVPAVIGVARELAACVAAGQPMEQAAQIEPSDEEISRAAMCLMGNTDDDMRVVTGEKWTLRDIVRDMLINAALARIRSASPSGAAGQPENSK